MRITARMRILVVEDSILLQKTLGIALRKSGYSVDIAGDGDEGLRMAESARYDAVVLDRMLPKQDGLSVVKNLRAKGDKTHILMLTALDSVEDRVHGIDAGADDYLIKPFAMPELLARVNALCRRSYDDKKTTLRVGTLEIDFAARTVMRAGAPVELAAREYQLLEYLARRHGEVVSRTEIEAHIYDSMVDPMSNVVDSAICILRKKITGADEAAEPLIHTRRGLGYILARQKNTTP